MVAARQADLADADAIIAIWLHAWRVEYRGLVPDDAIARRTDEAAHAYWQAVLTDPERAAFVVVAESSADSVVGFAQAGPCEPEEPGYDLELWKLYIHPGCQRHGVGRLLMAAMAERLAARGVRSLMLRAFAGNRAAGFYERMGGRKVRREPYEILGARIDTILYGWPDLTLLQRPAGSVGQSVKGA